MVRVGIIRIASFLLLTAYAAICQQTKERAPLNSLPDAPLPQTRSAVGSLATAFPVLYPPSQFQTVELRDTAWKTRDWHYWNHWDTRFEQERKDTGEFHRQLVSLLQHHATYQPSSESGVIARAASAALGTLFRRDPSGQTRLKTSYVLGVLTSAVIHTAYRPYWNRPVSAPFSDFGSTVGNDAGMNLLHEFRPGLEQILKSHTPKFVSRIEASVAR
jgi:hypothetical protein